MSENRRGFFKKMAGAAVGLAGAKAALGTERTAAGAPTPPQPRPFAGAHFALELEKAKNVGFLRSVEGGGIRADVIRESTESCSPRKHLGPVKYEDLMVMFGVGMGADLYEWLGDFFQCEPSRRSGAIVAADFDFKERSRRSFSEAVISEITFPALDGSSKDAAYLTVTLTPETIRPEKGSGKKVTGCEAKKQKLWKASNFRLTIDGLDGKAVSRVDALTFTQKVVDVGGDVRRPEPAGIEVPNLVITLAESSAQSFFDWFEDFVIDGNNSQEEEKGGMLEYLTPDLKDVLFTLTFKNLGIFSLAPEKAEASADEIRRVKVEMYCESVLFKLGKDVAGC
jgi:T4-like virus tail tube protein gp19